MALDRIPTPTRRRRRRNRPTHDGTPRAIGYVRVSTDEQADSGAGMTAQRDAIQREADARGWSVRWIEDAGVSARSLNRPGLDEALRLLADGDADLLVVSKLDRVSRSVIDFCGLTERAEREGWQLRIMDLGLDMTTPHGRMASQMLAVFAEFERRMISQRTRDGLRVKKAQGVRIGADPILPTRLRRRMVRMRDRGMTYQAIADTLTAEGVPTAYGRDRWLPGTVRYVIRKATR